MGGHDVMTAEQEVFPDGRTLAQEVADRLMQRALKAESRFVVALSGGSTPKLLYTLMAQPEYAARFPWERTHFFLGDDRFVPREHADSNRRMIEESLLAHVPLPAQNWHPMPDSGDADEAARIYERELEDFYAQPTLMVDKPLFDVVLLGLGENGHTASLFPRQPVLEETQRWVASCVPDDAPHTRLTLTYPAIACSREIWFLVVGASKKDVLARVRAGDPHEPASRIVSDGCISFLADRAAAGVE
ncbi:MAG: 6-phosphogluconolactonase [Acetobacter sp.]|nr:6-phosphogluconolactonase [Acetobacter sp.]